MQWLWQHQKIHTLVKCTDLVLKDFTTRFKLIKEVWRSPKKQAVTWIWSSLWWGRCKKNQRIISIKVDNADLIMFEINSTGYYIDPFLEMVFCGHYLWSERVWTRFASNDQIFFHLLENPTLQSVSSFLFSTLPKEAGKFVVWWLPREL